MRASGAIEIRFDAINEVFTRIVSLVNGTIVKKIAARISKPSDSKIRAIR